MACLGVEMEWYFHAALRHDLRIVKLYWTISSRLSKHALKYPHGCCWCLIWVSQIRICTVKRFFKSTIMRICSDVEATTPVSCLISFKNARPYMTRKNTFDFETTDYLPKYQYAPKSLYIRPKITYVRACKRDESVRANVRSCVRTYVKRIRIIYQVVHPSIRTYVSK